MLTCAAILFDMDGVLVDSHRAVERTWLRWSALRGVHVPGLVQRAHGRRPFETVQEIAPHLDVEEEVSWLAAAEEADLDGVVALPGAQSLLEALTDAEHAIVTSSGRGLARRRLGHAGLPVPRLILSADDVRSGKPSPEGYLEAARRLGVAAGDCAVFEDTPAGISAGRAAGATVIGLRTTFPTEDLAAADRLIDSLAQVRLERRAGALHLHFDEAVAGARGRPSHG